MKENRKTYRPIYDTEGNEVNRIESMFFYHLPSKGVQSALMGTLVTPTLPNDEDFEHYLYNGKEYKMPYIYISEVERNKEKVKLYTFVDLDEVIAKNKEYDTILEIYKQMFDTIKGTFGLKHLLPHRRDI